jgi:hypothetical protein
MRLTGLAFPIGLLLLLVFGDSRVLESAVANPMIPISTVSLTRESVRMDIAPESLVVHGDYSFKRLDLPSVCAVYFPFPRDSVADRPRLLDAAVSFGSDDRHPIDVDCHRRPWLAMIETGGADSFVVSLTYSQRTDRSRASYPLTSRYRWFTPTESIRIEVALPTSIMDPHFSLPFAVRPGPGSVKTYAWSSIGALPDHDMNVSWRVRSSTRRQDSR